ncbi:MAG: VWA domain-containing protein [Bacteroidia bacterium]|nr:VWA domain-containing protein [Bacteroidia bacterium]
MIKIFLKVFCIVIYLFSVPVFAQSNCKPCEEKKKKALQASPLTRVLIIFDASNSMKGKWNGQEKISIAKTLAIQLIDSLSKIPNVQIALRVYGSTIKYPPGDCKDSKLVIPFQSNNIKAIKQYVQSLVPTGITPIEYSLIESSKDFPDNKSLNNIIIITDGIEECDGDPCKARQYLESQGIVFKPFIIGIGLSSNQSQVFNCVGNYMDAQQKDIFKNITQVIEQQKLNKTTLQVNLLDLAGKPLETDVNITFYDSKKNTYMYNYIHSLNEINNPDTIIVPSHITYKLIAHTIPPFESEITKLNEGKHNIIPINTPQGALFVYREKGNYNFNEKLRVVVRDKNTKKIFNVQNLNTTEKYIVGNYELDILTLPKIQTQVQIPPAKTSTISVPSSGELKLQSLEAGDGSIFVVKNNNYLEWVCNLSKSTEQIFYLLPGKYKIVWRAKSMRSSIYTIEKEIEIKPHQSYLIKLY